MTTQISAESITPITHNQIPVITTELLAHLYGADIKNIQNNYARNTTRFIAGKHFYKVTGDELKKLRLSLSESQNLQPSLRGLQISPKVRSLILWTERGAARHAKMLETDQAWEVFEKLEDCYFSDKTLPATTGAINLDILLAIRDDKVAFITQYQAGTLITIDDALSLLRKRGWLVMPREELAGKLMEL
ncbi:TPA: ORF6N domain-containing protein [Klebsiella aerogenes]|uniref:ORF6N domain-containing protein n=1 Tax=Klebsiella aerogenes TaxID=548 RepID=UPI002FF58102